MIFVRCADELIIRSIHEVPNPADFPCRLVNVGFRGDAGFICFILNLLTMLIRTGLEEDIVSFLTLKAGDSIGQNDLIRISDMRLA